MYRFLVFSLLFVSSLAIAEQNQEPAIVPEPPELPAPVESGETLEPADITITRKGEKVVQEYRRNGELYMVKIIPKVGPAYYLIDTDGDGTIDVRGNDLDSGTNINQWKVFGWD